VDMISLFGGEIWGLVRHHPEPPITLRRGGETHVLTLTVHVSIHCSTTACIIFHFTSLHFTSPDHETCEQAPVSPRSLIASD